MSKHYLITGGAGFIGSHLCERLVAAGHRVTILDDFSTGREENIATLRSNPNVHVIRDTVENERTVNIAVSSVHAVFHLASAVGVQLVLDEPVRTIRTTIHGTEVVLDACQRFGRPVFITSSSEVYGKGARVPFAEDDDVVMGATRTTRYCYAYCKGIDEFLALAYHKQFRLPAVVVRLFNTVGPRQVGMYGMVMPRFITSALRNEPLKVHGDGKQTRCFCHVSDVTHAITQLMNTPAAFGHVFNLGGSEEISILELAKRVIAISGSTSTIEFLTYEQAYGHAFEDMQRRVPDLSRIQRAISFAPKFNLDEIIRSVIDDQRKVR